MLMENVRRAKNTAARWELIDRGLANVYAIRAASAVKFGQTCGPVEKRLAALQTACPVDLELLGSTLCAAAVEGGIHDYLKPRAHLRGEWFVFDHPESQEIIRLIQTQQGGELLRLTRPEYYRANVADANEVCMSIDL